MHNYCAAADHLPAPPSLFLLLTDSQQIPFRHLINVTLFSGLAAKVYCQSGFASGAAGFHQTPPQTSQPWLTQSLGLCDTHTTVPPCHCSQKKMGGQWMPGYSAKWYSFKEIGNAASYFYTAELAEISTSLAEEDWQLLLHCATQTSLRFD